MLIRPFCRRLLPVVVLLSSISWTLADEKSGPQATEPTYVGRSPLMLMTIDGKELHQLTQVPGYEDYGSPLWSHDGTKVAFDACSGNYLANHVFVVGVDGASPCDLGDGSMPSWAPDDRRLIIHRHGKDSGIWTIQPDGTGLERHTTQGSGARWSPDGLQIAHLSFVEASLRDRSEQSIMVYNTVEGTDQVLLGNRELPPRFRMPTAGFQWSPDGRRLGLIAERNDRGLGVFIYTLEGPERGLKLRLEAEENRIGMGVAWSPDGKEALVSLRTEADRALQLYRIEVDSDAAPIRLPGQDPDRAASDLAWSPDGEWVVFSSSPAN